MQLTTEDKLYCIGDYVDRGPDSKGVIDTILELREQGFQIHCLRGNHEEMMMKSVLSELDHNFWMRNGGDTTLSSFGIAHYSEMEERYKKFFGSTKYIITTDDYIFVHAGLNFENEDLFSDMEAMLWTRGFEPQQPRLNKLIIHGHTPESIEYILGQKGNCINIDGGCVYKHLGKLVAISLPSKEFIYIGNLE